MLTIKRLPSTASDEGVLVELFAIGLPVAPVLLIVKNEKFGMFSFYEQLLGKPCGLPVRAMYSVCELHASRGARGRGVSQPAVA
jgi:hypothetical protein